MSIFDKVWSIVKEDEYDWDKHEAEYGPDVNQNVMNIPGMAELLQDLQKYSHHCLDSMDERVAVAEGLLSMGYSKSPNLSLSHRQRRNLE